MVNEFYSSRQWIYENYSEICEQTNCKQVTTYPFLVFTKKRDYMAALIKLLANIRETDLHITQIATEAPTRSQQDKKSTSRINWSSSYIQ